MFAYHFYGIPTRWGSSIALGGGQKTAHSGHMFAHHFDGILDRWGSSIALRGKKNQNAHRCGVHMFAYDFYGIPTQWGSSVALRGQKNQNAHRCGVHMFAYDFYGIPTRWGSSVALRGQKNQNAHRCGVHRFAYDFYGIPTRWGSSVALGGGEGPNAHTCLRIICMFSSWEDRTCLRIAASNAHTHAHKQSTDMSCPTIPEKHANDTPKTCKWYTKNMQMIHQKHANDTPKTCKWYTKNMQMIHQHVWEFWFVCVCVRVWRGDHIAHKLETKTAEACTCMMGLIGFGSGCIRINAGRAAAEGLGAQWRVASHQSCRG